MRPTALLCLALVACVSGGKDTDDDDISGDSGASDGSGSDGSADGSGSDGSGSDGSGSEGSGSEGSGSDGSGAEDSGFVGTDGSGSDGGGTDGADGGSSPLPADWSACTTADGDSFELAAGSVIDGSSLIATVSYGGGCAGHIFVPCWDGAVAESYPPQIWVELYHENNGDACDAWVTETLTLDLLPVSGAFGTASGEVVIHFGGESLLYSW